MSEAFADAARLTAKSLDIPTNVSYATDCRAFLSHTKLSPADDLDWAEAVSVLRHPRKSNSRTILMHPEAGIRLAPKAKES